MSAQSERYEWVSKTSRVLLIVSLALIAICLAGTAALGVMAFLPTRNLELLPPYVVALVIELLAAGCSMVMYGLVQVLVSSESQASASSARLERVETLLNDISTSSRRSSDLASLSDQAKSLIFRDRELEALRESIHEDLNRQDFASAQVLIDTMETRFSCAVEAARLRTEIATLQSATLQEKIDSTVARIQQTMERHDWPRAAREIQKVQRLYSNSPKVLALSEQLETAKVRHKSDLLQAYDEAVRKKDVDRSIELLKELDRYLTPQEAAALEESARGVFRAKLHNLNVQFALRVTEAQWTDAIAVGEEIVREFPNTRMAEEVRQKMDMLKTRAAEAAAASK